MTHIPMANCAARRRSANSEIGIDSEPATTSATTIAMYGGMPKPAKNTVP